MSREESLSVQQIEDRLKEAVKERWRTRGKLAAASAGILALGYLLHTFNGWVFPNKGDQLLADIIDLSLLFVSDYTSYGEPCYWWISENIDYLRDLSREIRDYRDMIGHEDD